MQDNAYNYDQRRQSFQSHSHKSSRPTWTIIQALVYCILRRFHKTLTRNEALERTSQGRTYTAPVSFPDEIYPPATIIYKDRRVLSQVMTGSQVGEMLTLYLSKVEDAEHRLKGKIEERGLETAAAMVYVHCQESMFLSLKPTELTRRNSSSVAADRSEVRAPAQKPSGRWGILEAIGFELMTTFFALSAHAIAEQIPYAAARSRPKHVYLARDIHYAGKVYRTQKMFNAEVVTLVKRYIATSANLATLKKVFYNRDWVGGYNYITAACMLYVESLSLESDVPRDRPTKADESRPIHGPVHVRFQSPAPIVPAHVPPEASSSLEDNFLTKAHRPGTPLKDDREKEQVRSATLSKTMSPTIVSCELPTAESGSRSPSALPAVKVDPKPDVHRPYLLENSAVDRILEDESTALYTKPANDCEVLAPSPHIIPGIQGSGSRSLQALTTPLSATSRASVQPLKTVFDVTGTQICSSQHRASNRGPVLRIYETWSVLDILNLLVLHKLHFSLREISSLLNTRVADVEMVNKDYFNDLERNRWPPRRIQYQSRSATTREMAIQDVAHMVQYTTSNEKLVMALKGLYAKNCAEEAATMIYCESFEHVQKKLSPLPATFKPKPNVARSENANTRKRPADDKLVGVKNWSMLNNIKKKSRQERAPELGDLNLHAIGLHQKDETRKESNSVPVNIVPRAPPASAVSSRPVKNVTTNPSIVKKQQPMKKTVDPWRKVKSKEPDIAKQSERPTKQLKPAQFSSADTRVEAKQNLSERKHTHHKPAVPSNTAYEQPINATIRQKATTKHSGQPPSDFVLPSSSSGSDSDASLPQQPSSHPIVTSQHASGPLHQSHKLFVDDDYYDEAELDDDGRKPVRLVDDSSTDSEHDNRRDYADGRELNDGDSDDDDDLPLAQFRGTH